MTIEAHENHPGQPLLGLGLSDQLGPLPKAEQKGWIYTSAQMKAYALQSVAAERERCAKMCEQYADDAGAWRPLDGTRGAAAREVARRIRGPNV